LDKFCETFSKYPKVNMSTDGNLILTESVDYKIWGIMHRDQLNSRRKKCVISWDVPENMSNFTENSHKEFQKFTGPTDVILRCYANAN